MLTVAALYIDPRGPYPKLPGVECWDETRDARKYDGPHPVVAHPPCGPWGRLRHLYRGNEHDCAARAVEQVRKFGGVLEHPALSRLWDSKELSLPYPGNDDDFGFTMMVDQCEWGHVARKRTWLYIVGASGSSVEVPPMPGRPPTHWVSGFRNEGKGKHPKRGQACPPGIKICSSQQRRRTPPLFAEYLVRLARAAGEARSAA